ncbi:hypothetical protein [Sphingomonas faeni]|uniref:hypothetical protein n=1 Tax=Sphingomonas faeni TaxID=185950 RepID=UPI00335B1BD7
MTEQSKLRRGIAVALTAAVLLPVEGYLAVASSAVNTVSAMRASALLTNKDPQTMRGIRGLPQGTVDAAIAAKPVDQRIVNVAMIRDVQTAGASRIAPWIDAVTRLGWRDTPALQNRLYVSATRANVADILDVSDALLRRRQLMDQIIPVLATVETDPSLRKDFVRRLSSKVNWGGLYLQSTGALKTPAQFQARYEVMMAMQQRGLRLDSGVLIPNVDALDRADLPALAFELWKSRRPGITSPLNDVSFVQAATNFQSGTDTVPYEWQMKSGQGYNASAYVEHGRGSLDIEWNGRGVPVFAEQRTSATPGRYALDVGTSAENVGDLSALNFTLVCAEDATPLVQDARNPKRFATSGAVPCAYPVLRIAGDIQAAATPRHIAIDRLVLRRVGTANEGA